MGAVTGPATARGGGYLGLLRNNPSFRLLWGGQVISLLGDWFTLIATATLVGQLTGSELAVGGLFVVRMLPSFLVSPFAGVAADRANRKHLLIGADLVRMVVVLGFLTVRSPSDVWLLYALTAVQVAMSGLFYPARNALLPSIVSARELGAANALSASTWSVMLALGAALGGFAAGRWGVSTAFVIDSATYLVSALLLSRIRYRPADGDRGSSSVASALADYVDGLRYLAHRPPIASTAVLKAGIAIAAGGAMNVIMVALAQQRFVLGEGGGTALGLMYAAAGAGTGIGPIVARRLTGDEPGRLRAAVPVAFLIAGVGLAVIAPLASLAVVLAGIFLRGFGAGINWVFSTQLLMSTVDDRVRGRVFSIDFALFTLAHAISTAVAGWVLDRTAVDVTAVVWFLATLSVAFAALWGVLLAARREAGSQ